MNPHDAGGLLGRAERIVEMATARGADEAEVYMMRSVSLDIDIENNRVQNTGRSRVEGGGIRVIQDGRLGFAYFTTDDAAENTIDRALKLTKLAPKKGLELPDPQSPTHLDGRWDDGLAELDVAYALDLATALLDGRNEHAADCQLAGGGVNLGYSLEALANSRGIGVCERSTEASAGVNLVMESGETAVNAWDSMQSHQPDIAPATLIRSVAEDLRSLRDPQPAASGEVDVVFRPDAVSELITGLILSAVDGDDAMRGKTVWSDKLGEQVAASGVQLLDDPTVAGALGAGEFDGDGLPARRLPIIQDGVLQTFLFDIRDGHDHGRPSTHSAVRSSFKSVPGVGTNHVVLTGSQTVPDDKLIAGVDDGYLVESVLGAHTANATTGDFSVTAPNVWRIQGGEVIGAASEIAIGGNLPDLLHRLDGIGAKPKAMDGAQVPMVRFRDVRVST